MGNCAESACASTERRWRIERTTDCCITVFPQQVLCVFSTSVCLFLWASVYVVCTDSSASFGFPACFDAFTVRKQCGKTVNVWANRSYRQSVVIGAEHQLGETIVRWTNRQRGQIHAIAILFGSAFPNPFCTDRKRQCSVKHVSYCAVDFLGTSFSCPQ